MSLTHQEARELASANGLELASRVPPLRAYLKSTWDRRDFIRELADARSTAQYSDSLLGRLWQLATPLLNAGIYYFIFGVLLNTRRGIDNFTAFLIAGVFAFNFMQATVTACAACIPKNKKLINAIPFPKLVLPLATAVQQMQQYLVSLAVLLIIVLFTGEPLTLSWLLIVPVILMQALFTLGLGLIFARWGAYSRDISQILPFFLRAWRYASGVFFSIVVITEALNYWVGRSLQLNPGAVYLDLLRDALMTSTTVDPIIWVFGVVWSVGFFVLGLFYFHRGERKYV